MNTTEYKGFNITENNGRLFVSACGGYPHDSFNPDGYATMNNAKGAITKHLKAVEERHNAFCDDVAGMAKEDKDAPTPKEQISRALASEVKAARKNKPATNDKADKASDAAAHPLEVATGMPFADKIADIVNLHSRNKREGRYAGKSRGSHSRARCNHLKNINA